jgi:hypothetical protein
MKINLDKMQWHWEQYLIHNDTAREHLSAASEAIHANDYDTWQTRYHAYLAEAKIANRHLGTHNAMQTKWERTGFAE